MKIKNSKILKKNNTYNARGITLIALVITIVILIILAGVAINLTLGENGIFNKAEYAKEQQKMAEAKEKIDIAILDIQADKISKGEECTVDTIISELPGKVSGLEISKDGDNGKGTYNGCDFTITPDLKVTIDGYNPTTGGSGQQINPDLAKLKAGDYIKYDTGVEGIGVITCRVLYEANSQYGLQIITDKNIKQKIDGEDTEIKVELGGSDWATASASYNSAIKTLNDEAERYLNTAYATDARCVGSLPTVQNGTFVDKDKGTQTTVTLPPPVPEGEDSSTWWSSYTRPSGWTSDDTGCYDTDTNYTSDGVEGIVRDKETMEALGIWTTGERYWLASRFVQLSSKYCYFRVSVVLDSGNLGHYGFGVVEPTGRTYVELNTCGFRPCFSLRTDINITGGDGTSEATAYTM